MKMFRILGVTLLSFGLSIISKAQDKSPVNFDKISVQDFTINSNVDSSFGAVILADIGKSSFEPNNKGFFSLVYKFQRRVKIISSKGFDIATVKIPLYKSATTDSEEALESLSAVTYNLVNGKIEETKLDKASVYKEVLDKTHTVRKFTMPAVKEGSIIDISYTINSHFLFNLQPWRFQGSYPRLWSEYNLNLPEFFHYVFLSKGTHPLHIQDKKEKQQTYRVRIPAESAMERDDVISLNSTNTISRWVMKDVPALKEESFTSSMDNHLAAMEFQMSGQKFPDMPFRDIMGSWAKVYAELLKDKEFGNDLNDNADWVKKTLKTLPLEENAPIENAKKIYAYIQQSLSSLGTRNIYLTQSLKQTFTSKKGYVPDINLLLTLFLRKADINAYPVILSTRSNGFATAQYPLLHQYNYVVTKIEVGNQHLFLDASNATLSFGKLPSYCYNGYAQVIDKWPGAEYLTTDSLTEKKYTSVILTNSIEDDGKWIGPFNSSIGYYESLGIKEDIKEKGQPAFEKKLNDAYTGDYSIEKIELKGVDDNESQLTLSHFISITKNQDADIIYFNPMLKEGIKENYFKSSDRKYPVELPYKIDETYSLHLEVPNGYVIEETPKSTRVTLNQNDGMFEYIISKSESAVTLNTRIRINTTVFSSDDYQTLRDFFDYVVKKHAEQIVFKKKK